ncbi:MAG: phenylacetate--CoA ligase family protein [Candidatus Hodarchaeales archaeon]|jgi:phenylacetate-CoA ligase
MSFYHQWRTFGIATMNLLTPYPFRRRFQKFMRTQYLPRKELRKRQLKKVQKLYKHACRETPYYSRLYRQGKIPNNLRTLKDLKKLPLMTKKVAMVSSPPCNLSQTVFSNKYWLLKQSTSGTTGTPFPYYQDLRKLKDHQSHILRGLTWIGHDFGKYYGRLSNVRLSGKMMKLYFKLYCQRNKRVFFPCAALSPATLSKYIAIMKRKNVKYLEGFVSAISALAKFVQDSQIDFQLSFVKTYGEMLFPKSRRFIEDVLNCEVFESYGAGELGEMALECQLHDKLHIYDESFIFEVIKDGEAVIGEEGNLAITDLMNYAQPFIRYEIGDKGVITDEFCSCGRKLSILQSIKGRCNDTVLSPSGIWISSSIFASIAEPLEDLIQWQVEQRTRQQLHYKLIVQEKKTRLESHIKSSLTKIDPSFDISFEYVEKIPKTAGAKLKCVISPFNPRTDLII